MVFPIRPGFPFSKPYAGSMTVSAIAEKTALSRTNTSNHLRCLSDGDLVVSEAHRRFTLSRLSDPRVVALLKLANELLADIALGGLLFGLLDEGTFEDFGGFDASLDEQVVNQTGTSATWFRCRDAGAHRSFPAHTSRRRARSYGQPVNWLQRFVQSLLLLSRGLKFELNGSVCDTNDTFYRSGQKEGLILALGFPHQAIDRRWLFGW
jgi:DNA-binding transcriptional ArsR family regulator